MSELHIHPFGGFRLVHAVTPPGSHTSPRLQVLPTDLMPCCGAPRLEKAMQAMPIFKRAGAQAAGSTNKGS